jgi:hypothetical protein
MSESDAATDSGEDGQEWLGRGSWLVDTFHNKIGVVTAIKERERDLSARVVIQWRGNHSQNCSVLIALEKLKSGRWRFDHAE